MRRPLPKPIDERELEHPTLGTIGRLIWNTLVRFVYDPIAWLDRYGWRKLTDAERLAAFHFYREVGKRMGIRDIPGLDV